jgi:hypothetical protein
LRRFKELAKRRRLPEGYQARKPQGRDEKEGVVRIQLKFTLEEWDKIQEQALDKNMFPRSWIMWRVKKKLG